MNVFYFAKHSNMGPIEKAGVVLFVIAGVFGIGVMIVQTMRYSAKYRKDVDKLNSIASKIGEIRRFIHSANRQIEDTSMRIASMMISDPRNTGCYARQVSDSVNEIELIKRKYDTMMTELDSDMAAVSAMTREHISRITHRGLIQTDFAMNPDEDKGRIINLYNSIINDYYMIPKLNIDRNVFLEGSRYAAIHKAG